jgi:heme A synthase
MKIFSRLLTLVVFVVNLFVGIWTLALGGPIAAALISFAVAAVVVFASWKMDIWKRNAFPWTKTDGKV